MIDAILLTVAVCFGVSHFGPKLWAMLPKTKLLDQFRQIEAVAKADVQPLVQTVEKETKVISDIVQQKLAALGAALTKHKQDATDAQAQAQSLQAQLEASNAHVADLTAQLAAEQANHADDVNAVSALADQAAQ